MVVFLSKSDAVNFREMWRWFKKNVVNAPAREEPPDTFLPPEVYFAKAQSADGIPAKGEGDNEPGSGLCDIYKLDNSIPPALVAISSFEKTVYNYGETPIGQDWITIARTKFGKWIPSFTSDAQTVFGKMDEAIATGETKTMSVWGGTTLSDTGENLEVTDWLLGAAESISSGKKVICIRYHDSWYIIAAECE